jgi:RNA polymerase sigma-70 factor (ECF subfamily)
MDVPKLVKWRLDANAACGDGTLAPFAVLRVVDRDRRDSEPASAAEARHAVTVLFDEIRASLYRYLRWMGSTPEQTDDAIQEAFLRLYTHLGSGGSRENVRAWVFRVATNLIRDERRSVRWRRSDPLPEHSAGEAAFVDPIAGPEEIAAQNESNRRLSTAMQALPIEQQKCLALRSQGLRYREIGETLGIGTTTVSDLLQRAVRTLSKELP